MEKIVRQGDVMLFKVAALPKGIIYFSPLTLARE